MIRRVLDDIMFGGCFFSLIDLQTARGPQSDWQRARPFVGRWS